MQTLPFHIKNIHLQIEIPYKSSTKAFRRAIRRIVTIYQQCNDSTQSRSAFRRVDPCRSPASLLSLVRTVLGRLGGCGYV